MLTIVIPTYNRGGTLLKNINDIKRNAGDLKICVINNASTKSEYEYKKIKEICEAEPAKMRYVCNVENILLTGSIIRAMEIVDTEYMLILSDEDLIVDHVGDLFRKFLSENGPIIAGRPSILAKDGISYYAEYEGACYDELVGVSVLGLTGNYISGQIYNVKTIREKNLIQIFRDNVYKLIDYSHLAMNMICCAHGRTALIHEAYTMQKDEDIVQEVGDPSSLASRYCGPYSYGNRLNQFLGFRDLLRQVLQIDTQSKNMHLFYISYLTLCKKYAHLLLAVQVESMLNQGIHPKLMATSLKYFFLGALCNFPGSHQVAASLEKNILILINGYLKNINIDPIT